MPTLPLAQPTFVPIDYVRLQTISRSVQLEDVTLTRIDYTSVADPRRVPVTENNPSEFTLSLVDARWWRDDTLFEVCLGYDIIAKLRDSAETKGPTLFRLVAGWVATYALPADFQRPENHTEAAADFLFANGQVNVFPFLRQLVVDVSAKAGWPPLILPVFRVPKERPVGLAQNAPAWGSAPSQ